MKQLVSRQIGAIVAVVACWAAVSISAQTPQEKARVDFEVAKKALASGDATTALKRFESVLAVLGPFPEIELGAARAAVVLKNFPTAKTHIQAAFASADETFKKSSDYQALISLAADVDLAFAKEEETNLAARSAGGFRALRQRLLSSIEAQTGVGGRLLQNPEWFLPTRAFKVTGVCKGDRWQTLDNPLIQFWLLDWGLAGQEHKAGDAKVHAYWVALAFRDPIHTSWSQASFWEGEVFVHLKELAAVPARDSDYLSMLGESATTTWLAMNDHGNPKYLLAMTPDNGGGWPAQWAVTATEKCKVDNTTLIPGDVAVFKDRYSLIQVYHKDRWDSGYDLVDSNSWDAKPCAVKPLKIDGIEKMLCASGLATGVARELFECTADQRSEPKP